MSEQIQPQYQLFVNNVDVTNDVTDDVTLVEEPNNITNLTFTLSGNKYSIGVADIIKIGDKITFSGGSKGFSKAEPNQLNYRMFFSGLVKNLSPQYQETGLTKCTVEALDTGYVAFTEKIYHCYPSKGADKRTWSNKDSITAEEIARNIIEKELNMTVKTIDIVKGQPYTRKNPTIQRGMNDWKFLQKLAKENGCDVFCSVTPEGRNEISLIDIGKQKNSDDKKVRFIYPLRESLYDKTEPNKNTFYTKEINNIKGVADIPVLSLTITQDLTLFYANRRSVDFNDPATGESINVIQTYDELTPAMEKVNRDYKAQGKKEPYVVTLTKGTKSFVTAYYRMEVDETTLPPAGTKEHDAVKKIAQSAISGEGGVDFDDMKKYFKKAEFLDPRFKVVDAPYVGIDVTAQIEGEVYLKNERSYQIIGVQRYDSSRLDESYHLRTITHTWGDSGYLCDLQFKL